MNLRMTPRRLIALVFLFTGFALQLYADFRAENGYLVGVGIGFIVVGTIIELFGQWLGGDKRR